MLIWKLFKFINTFLINIDFFVSAAGNLLNAVLDPLLIFFCGFGIGGAAIATVISEYVNNVVNLFI